MKSLFSHQFSFVMIVCLTLLALTGNSNAQDRMPTLEDAQYSTACGPIACFVALQSLGVETSLDETAQRSGWIQDEFLPLESLQTALKSYPGIDCQIKIDWLTENAIVDLKTCRELRRGA